MSDEETQGLEVENLDTAENEIQETEAPTETTTEEKPVVEEAAETPEGKAEKEAAELLASETEEGDEEEKPAYTPNFKFKASGKDHEIPENFRSLITDEKMEKEVKSLYQRAYGADALIEKNTKLEGRLTETSQERDSVKGAVDSLRHVYSEAVKHPSEGGNLLKLDQFFRKLKIPTDVILQYAASKVQLEQLPPDQRDAIVARLQAEEKNQALTTEQGQSQGQQLETVRRLRAFELSEELSKPDIKAIAEDFDKRMGKTGAFKEAVRSFGEMAWYRQKVDLPPDQAVQKVIEEYGLKVPEASPGAPSKAPNAPAAGQTRPVVQRTTKVIPNVQGKSNLSPLKDKPRSIDDIKKLSARASAGEPV